MVDAADLKSENRGFCKFCDDTKNDITCCTIKRIALAGFGALWRVLAELLHNYFTVNVYTWGSLRTRNSIPAASTSYLLPGRDPPI